MCPQGTLFKRANHSNLGKDWEADLRATHDFYRLNGVADIVKNAEQWNFISDKEYEEKLQLIALRKYTRGTLAVTDEGKKMLRSKSDIDFTGGARNAPVCFDAKEVTGERLPIVNLKAHQIQRLMMSARCGTMAGFMVRFVPAARAFFVPVRYVRQREDQLLAQTRRRRAKPGTASISIADMEKNATEIFVNRSNGLWDWINIVQ